MKPIAEPLPISAGMAKRCWQSLLCSALGAGASQKQTGKVPRQGEGKHLTPYLININRHINNRISTCAVICNPPVNMLTRPNWRCPAEARRQGRVWECTVSLGAADGLGAGCCGHKAVEGSAGTSKSIAAPSVAHVPGLLHLGDNTRGQSHLLCWNGPAATTTSALGPTCVYSCASFVQRPRASSLVAACGWQCRRFVLCVLWARRKSGV